MSLLVTPTKRLSIADHALLTLAAGDFTLAGWVKIVSNAGTSSQFFCSWNTTGASHSCNWRFYEATYGTTAYRNKLRFHLRDGYSVQPAATSTGTPGTSTIWQHLALIVASGVFTQYIDGVADGESTPGEMHDINAATAWGLGGYYDGTEDYGFVGYVAEWAKWDRALSVGADSELAALVAGGHPENVATPAWCVPMKADKEPTIGALVTSLEGDPAPSFYPADHPVGYGVPPRRLLQPLIQPLIATGV